LPEDERQIAFLDQQIVEEVWPDDESYEVNAIDGQMYKAQMWHVMNCEGGLSTIPPLSDNPKAWRI